MITLSDEAGAQFQKMLDDRKLAGHGLRIFVEGGGCAGLKYGMYFESTQREGDTVVEVSGVRLYVDPFSARCLEGARIDYLGAPANAGFRVDNPNAVSICACGASFRIE